MKTDWHLVLKHLLLDHYPLSVLVLALPITILPPLLLSTSFSRLKSAALWSMAVLPAYIIVLLFLMGEYLPPQGPSLLPMLAGYIILMALLSIVQMVQVTRENSRRMVLSTWQSISQELVIGVSVVMLLGGGYLLSTDEHQLGTFVSVCHYLSSLLVVGSVVLALRRLNINYQQKTVQLWLDLKVDWRKDTLSMAHLENQLAIVMQQTRYLEEKYLMTGNKMERSVKDKYQQLLWEKERLCHRQKQARSLWGAGLRIKKDLVLLGGLLKTMFQLQVYVLLLLALWLALFNKMVSQPLDLQQGHGAFVVKVVLIGLFLQALGEDKEQNDMVGSSNCMWAMVVVGAVTLAAFIVPSSLGGAVCMETTWLRGGCMENKNLFAQVAGHALRPEMLPVLFGVCGVAGVVMPMGIVGRVA